MPQEQSLLPYINQAYGQGTQLPSIQPFQQTFEKQAEEKKQDYKSAAELGIELDAKGWEQWSKQLEGLYEQAANGDIVIGSPEWMASKQKLAANASQLKQTQELTKQMYDSMQENPDQFIYRTVDENGNPVIKNAGEFLNTINELYQQDYANPQELVNRVSQELTNVNALPQGLNQAVKEGRNTGLRISQELQQMGITAPQYNVSKGVWSLVTGQDVENPELVSKINEEVNSLVEQYRPYLETRYEQITPPQERSQDGLNDYIENEVKSWLFPYGKPDVRGGRVPAGRTSKDNSFKYTGSGWNFGDYYGSVMREEITDPKFGVENDVVTGITVESMKTNPQQDFVDKGGRITRGSLARITREDGDIVLKIRSGGRTISMPLDENFDILRTEYGLDEATITQIFEGEMQNQERVIGNEKDPLNLGI